MDKEKYIIYNEQDLDKDASVLARDIELETRQYKKLYKRYVMRYIDTITRLGSDPSFVRDDSYNGIHAKHHIMYKLICDSHGSTHLVSRDGRRGYEFLVEFDVKDTAYGIYYGCRAMIYGGDQDEQIDILKAEWDEIREEVRAVLNATFTNINFMPERFQPTNNANNKTFWTFWISLYPEEDILKVAALAVKLIKGVYQNYLETGKTGIYNNRAKSIVDTGLTRYTEDAYRRVLKKLDKPERIADFETFLARGVEIGLLEPDTRYERCWKVRDPQMSNDEFSFVLAEFCTRRHIEKYDKWCWSLFSQIIISASCGPLDDLRKAWQRFDSKVEPGSTYLQSAKALLDRMGLPGLDD